jgi:RimJ/RimL family protein N-acetyltransferase/cytochrome c553
MTTPPDASADALPLDSPRLLLLPCTVAHFEAALYHHTALAELLGVAATADWTGSAEATEVLAPARDYLRQHPEAHGWWTYLLIHKADQKLVGMGGFKGVADTAGVVEIGYSLMPDYRGQGLATEAAQALVEFAFRHPEVQRVDAHTLPERNASCRILEKLGMECTGMVIDPQEGVLWHWMLPRKIAPTGGLGRPLTAVLALALALLTSCGDATAPQSAGNSNAAATAEAELPGKAIFLQNCAICHGQNGQLGLNGAHDLTKSNLNQMGRVYMVTNGLGKMPGFKGQLTPEQIEQVAAYTLTLK